MLATPSARVVLTFLKRLSISIIEIVAARGGGIIPPKDINNLVLPLPAPQWSCHFILREALFDTGCWRPRIPNGRLCVEDIVILPIDLPKWWWLGRVPLLLVLKQELVGFSNMIWLDWSCHTREITWLIQQPWAPMSWVAFLLSLDVPSLVVVLRLRQLWLWP